MDSNSNSPEVRRQIIEHKTLRILIGAAGVLLPLLLFTGNWISECTTHLEFSISDYYDNGAAGDILVGILFVLGFFLFSYHGYDAKDDLTANLGGAFALGVALFPTTSANPVIHSLHFVFATLLFVAFAVFSIWLFRKSNVPKEQWTKKKSKRNMIYFLCGIIIIACIVAIPVCIFFFHQATIDCHLVFWIESIALLSFGFSWLTKAEWFMLKD